MRLCTTNAYSHKSCEIQKTWEKDPFRSPDVSDTLEIGGKGKACELPTRSQVKLGDGVKVRPTRQSLVPPLLRPLVLCSGRPEQTRRAVVNKQHSGLTKV